MNCPRCGAAMQQHSLPGHHERTVEIDLCEPCQSFWFDTHEVLQLAPEATLRLFRVIGEHAQRPQLRDSDVAKCPRCRARLQRTRDMQRSTRFEYLKCPHDHGRLMSFFEFLKAKNFIKSLTAAQIAELRRHVQMVNCSNCGAPINLANATACAHCGSALSMLDLQHAEETLAQLRGVANKPVDSSLPIDLMRARAEVEAALRDAARAPNWYVEVAASGLVGAGLRAMTRWLQQG